MKSVLLLAIGALVWCLPAPTGRAAEKQDHEGLVSSEQVQGWVKRWQERLRLQDWKVEAHIVRRADLKPETLGNLKWNSEDKTAAIKVLDPRDYDLAPDRIAQDMELTVVHELIHLHLSVLPRDPLKKGVEEQVVDKISIALFNLEKQGDIATAASDGKKTTNGSGVASRNKHTR